VKTARRALGRAEIGRECRNGRRKREKPRRIDIGGQSIKGWERGNAEGRSHPPI